MRFYTFFDAREAQVMTYGPTVLFLVFAIGGAWWASLDGRQRGGPLNLPAYLRSFGALIAAFAGALFILSVSALVHRQAEITRIMAERNYQVVEGVVADFQPDPSGGHGVERFRVGSSWLGYRGPTDTGGFHQLRADGGPIADGRRVRMAVDRQGRILKLEIAE